MTAREELILLAKSAIAMKAQAAKDYKFVVDQLPGANKTHAIRRLLGLCPECGKLADAGFYCQTHRDKNTNRARKENMSEETEHQADRTEPATVECDVCGGPTPMTGTHMCNRCWELDHRIKADPKLAESILNSMRGSIRSKAKTAAARANGKAGGRPTLPPGVKGKYERRTP